MAVIVEGQTVTFKCSLFLEDGTCLDDPNDTQQFVLKAVSKIPQDLLGVISNNLIGMNVNENKNINVPAKKAFGERDRAKIHKLTVGIDDDFRVGDPIKVNVSRKAGDTSEGVVVKVYQQYIEADTNHPLAGKNILVKVKILSIKD